MGWAAVDSQQLRTGESALRGVPTNNDCFFNTSTNFSCVKMRKDVRPKKRSLFHGPPPACHSCLPISSAVSGANLMFTNDCLGFKTFQIRRTAGSGYKNTLEELPGFKEEPVVI